MYAVVRRNHVEPEKWDAAEAERAEFDRIHADQPGYITSLTVDAGEGTLLVINLWESASDAKQALVTMGPTAERTIVPLMKEPSELLGTGEVTQHPRDIRFE